METRQLNFDVSRGGVGHRLFVRAGDIRSRTVVSRFNSCGVPIDVAGAEIRILRPDNTEVLGACNVENNAVTYTFTGGEDVISEDGEKVSVCDLALPGEYMCEYILHSTDGAVMTSPQFVLIATDVLFGESGAKSSDSYPALLAALSKLSQGNFTVSAVSSEVGTEAKAEVEVGEATIHIDFVIPKGEKGETGAQGPQGEQGPAGADGKDGEDYVLTDADKEDIASSAAELVANDYAIRETIFIGLDGYCYSADGIAYPFSNLKIGSTEDLKKYNFVLASDDLYIPLAVHCDLAGMMLYFSAIYYDPLGYISYVSVTGTYCWWYYTDAETDTDVYAGEDAVSFYTTSLEGDYLSSYYGALSVDKNALLGDVESALDSIIEIKNSLIGGDVK